MIKQLTVLLRLSLLAVVGGVLSAPSAALAAPPEIVPGEFTVFLRANTGSATADQRLLGGAGRVVRRHRKLNAVRLKLHSGLRAVQTLQLLRQQGAVIGIEPVILLRASATPNDRDYDKQYGLPKIQANHVWDVWRPTTVVKVAILDTGVDYTHPDLSGVLDRTPGGDVNGYNSQTESTDARDDHGHGTHVAGTVAARINNQIGGAGVVGWNPSVSGTEAFVRLQPVKVLDEEGVGTDGEVADGIVWAADHGARVINLSLGSTGSSQVMSQAVKYAIDKGCVVVAAAGNDSVSDLNYPAAYPNVISVGATDKTDTVSDFSNYGSWVKIAAPGSTIFSTLPNGEYGWMSGTSMATPHVAGVVASILAQYPTLTPRQVETTLLSTTDPYVPLNGRGFAANAGRVNARRALDAAADLIPTPVAVTLNPTTVTGGSSVQATVTLSMAAGSGGQSVALTSSASTVSVPSSVVVAAGSTTATVSVTTQAVASQQQVTLTASANGRQTSSVLTVAPPSLTAASLQKATVVGGGSVAGTVTLNAPAPQGGMVVSLSSDVSTASVPSQVTVAAGATEASFNVTTQAVTAERSVIIRAVLGTTERTVRLLVQPPDTAQVSGLSLDPSSVRGGSGATGTVTLNRVAPAGGTTVTLSVSDPAASVPASVVVPQGAVTTTFPVTTVAVEEDTQVRISASLGGATVSADLSVSALPVKFKLTRSRASTFGGVQLSGAVRLTRPAPAGGLVIRLSSDYASVTVPSSVTVAAGLRTATFPINTSPVPSQVTVTITGQRAGISARARIKIRPPSLARLDTSARTVSSGGNVTGTLVLDAPAPTGGLSVALTSNSSLLTVPAAVTIPAGATEAQFQMQAATISRKGNAKVTARLNGKARAVTIRLVP